MREFYLVDGSVDVHVPIRAGEVVVGFCHGRPPKVIPLPDEAISLDIDAADLSDFTKAVLPMGVAAMPANLALSVMMMSQDDADAVLNEIIRRRRKLN